MCKIENLNCLSPISVTYRVQKKWFHPRRLWRTYCQTVSWCPPYFPLRATCAPATFPLTWWVRPRRKPTVADRKHIGARCVCELMVVTTATLGIPRHRAMSPSPACVCGARSCLKDARSCVIITVRDIGFKSRLGTLCVTPVWRGGCQPCQGCFFFFFLSGTQDSSSSSQPPSPQNRR